MYDVIKEKFVRIFIAKILVKIKQEKNEVIF